jgi:hypothetical protein
VSLRGLLNGQRMVALPTGAVLVVADVADASVATTPWLRLRYRASDGTQWERVIDEIECDPRREHSDSVSRDFVAAYWPAANVVALAGDSKAVLVSLVDGTPRLEIPLEFTGQSSLDVLELLVLVEPPALIVVSTRRVYALDPHPLTRWVWDPDGIVKSASVASPGVIVVEYYDVVDPALPLLSRRLDALTGRAL